MLRWLKPLVAAGWVFFTSHVCLPCPREEKEMWEDIALAGSGRMHTAELLLASGH